MTSGEFPRPPGFEDDNQINEAELAEFMNFMSSSGKNSGKNSESIVSALGDDRGLARQRGPPGLGLTGESTATVEVTRWKEDGVDGKDDAHLIDEDASFEELLGQDLLKGVYEMGFVKPSRIQAAALPIICTGNNMIGQAQNGSGKTATFSLALLSRLEIANEWPQAVVIGPTRELARQIESVIQQLGQYLPVKTLLTVPSQDRIPRNAKCHVVIGTPGKLFDLAKKRIVDLSGVQIFVLDEADMMLDQENMMGPQVTEIRKLLPKEVQVLFFSATYPDDVRDFAQNLVPRATSIKVRKEELTVSSVSQMYMRCNDEWDKFQKLTNLYTAMNVGQSVIFVNQRKRAFQLSKWMRDGGFAVSLICGTQTSGDERMDPALRDQVMDEFRNGVTRVLIATDVLARGIDVPQVTLVVNYDIPINYGNRQADMETYLHRVGRTGRFGLKGIAVNLVTDRERAMIDEVCAFFDCRIPEMDEDFEALEERLKMLR